MDTVWETIFFFKGPILLNPDKANMGPIYPCYQESEMARAI